MMTKKKLKEALRDLEFSDKYYLEKVVLISQLLEEPTAGHIICDGIVEWCRKIGLKPTCNCEDKTAWWTCSAI